ncbi:MAG: IPTL-CTERM sorting domain-containing protein [Thiothrix sp.]|nr:MAG: IPTL-CTERM sorting domain-containing protein [Thiothrix sp.]
MKKSLKQAVLRGIAFLLAAQAGYTLAAAPTEGVEFSVRWDAPTSVYKVYMRPLTTPSPDQSMTSQVTILVPHAELPNRFTVPSSSVASAFSGATWSNSSKALTPTENPNYDYLSFSATISDSQVFQWEAGVEQEIFSFKNTGKCLGSVKLIVNKVDPFDIIPNSYGTNPGNQFDNVGWPVNEATQSAYAGNYGTEAQADCTASATSNADPKATADTATVVAGSSVTIDVLANDTDANSDTLYIQHMTDGDFGKVTLKSGKLVYASDAAYTGTDTFNYYVSDAKGGVTEGTVTVTVTSPNTGTDTDGDGLTDTQEAALGTDPSLVDTDLDGVPDKVEVGTDLSKPIDTDGDGKIDALDTDDDGDGIPTKGEDKNADGDKNPATNPTDTDGDGKPNYLDADDDNDGKLTKNEDDNTDGDGNPATNPRDTDGDGIPDPLDPTDGATANTAPKAAADTASVVAGSSVTIDALANDTDADGNTLTIETVAEAAHGTVAISSNKIVYTADATYTGTDSFSYVAADGHGGTSTGIITVTVTAKPVVTDTDGDGLSDEQEKTLGTNPAAADSDADGIPDKTEVGSDLTKPIDTDGDGKINALDTDDDGDGKLTKDEDNKTDGDSNPATNPRDTDSDGIVDYLDANDASTPTGDDDGDGLSNADEGKLGTNPNKMDSDGDSVPDNKEVGSDLTKPLDTDGDGLINALDNDDDNDGIKTIYENYNNKGALSTDTDADGIPDYLDTDDDGDGMATAKETADVNKDGNPTDAADADKNGVPDYLDKRFINTVSSSQVAVPTLSQWAQIVLTLLLGVFAFRRFAKKD